MKILNTEPVLNLHFSSKFPQRIVIRTVLAYALIYRVQDSREFQPEATASDLIWPGCRRSSDDKYHLECAGALGRRQTNPNLAVPCRLCGAYTDTGRFRYDEHLCRNLPRESMLTTIRPVDAAIQWTLSGTRTTNLGVNVADTTVDSCVTHGNHTRWVT